MAEEVTASIDQNVEANDEDADEDEEELKCSAIVMFVACLECLMFANSTAAFVAIARSSPALQDLIQWNPLSSRTATAMWPVLQAVTREAVLLTVMAVWTAGLDAMARTRIDRHELTKNQLRWSVVSRRYGLRRARVYQNRVTERLRVIDYEMRKLELLNELIRAP